MGASYTPPAYYADLLAGRGRCYIKRFLYGAPELRGQSKEVVRVASKRNGTCESELAVLIHGIQIWI